jgi:hypothetical protein
MGILRGAGARASGIPAGAIAVVVPGRCGLVVVAGGVEVDQQCIAEWQNGRMPGWQDGS